MSDSTQVDGPKELREALGRAEERATAAEAAATEAQAALRSLQAEVTFDKAGLLPKHAELFLKTNPEAEISADSAQAFAEEYGLTVASTPAEAAPAEAATPPADAGLAAIGGAAGSATAGAAPAAQPKMSPADFQALLQTNPEEAARAYQEGRVERNERNVQANELVAKGVIAH